MFGVINRNMRNCGLLLRLSIFFFFCFPVWADTGDQKTYSVPNELLVKYRASAQLSKSSNHIRQKLRAKQQFSNLQVEHWVLPESSNVRQVIQQLQTDPAVEIVEPNYRRYPRILDTEINTRNAADSRLNQVKLKELWQTPVTRTEKVKIAVIDDAFDIDHEDLSQNIIMSYDGETLGNNPRPQACAESNTGVEDHGTEVLGVVGAVTGNGIGFDGASNNAELYPIRISCGYSVAAELAAIEWAIQQDVDIISASYGGPMYSELERIAFQKALAKEILIVIAAGNIDTDNDKLKDYPSGLDLPNILAVAGTDEANELAAWTQWGQTTVDLAAPGEGFGSTLYIQNDTNRYGTSLIGTSFSAPLVSGIIASLMMRDPYANEAFGLVFRAKAALMQSVVAFDKTPKARLAVDGYVDAVGALAKLDSLEPVIVIKSIVIDDSEFGNNNGVIDQGETINLVLELENQGTDAFFVQGNLTSSGLPLLNESFDEIDINGYESIDHSYNTKNVEFLIDFNNIELKQDILFKVALNGRYFLNTKTFTSDRYFSLDFGSLSNGVSVSNTLRKNDDHQDEFHFYTIDVPSSANELTVSLSGQNTTGRLNNLDLLVKYGSIPQFDYLQYPLHETLGDDAREPGVLISANVNVSEESINISSPSAGTYHIVVVVNESDKQSNINYSIQAQYKSGSKSSTNALSFDPLFYTLMSLFILLSYSLRFNRRSTV